MAGQRRPGGNDVQRALRANTAAFIGVGLVTAAVNLLYLTGSFFMLEVYDRVIPSHSIQTLVGLLVIATMLYAFQGMFDIIRSRVLVRIGAAFDETMSERIFAATVRLPRIIGDRAEALQPLRQLDQVRSFLSSAGPSAFFDLPWIPFYLLVCYLFHPLIGLTATIGALVLVVLTVLTEALSRGPNLTANIFGAQRHVLAETSRRNTEVISAMGMEDRMAAQWYAASGHYLASQRRAADVVGGLGAMTKVLRMLLQSVVLAVGAYLVVNQQATAGIMIASSILSSRALAPVETAIANWRGFLAARFAWRRLHDIMALLPATATPLTLPRPRQELKVEGVTAVPPGAERPVVFDVSFRLECGQALAIIGPSGSGKSSLARMLVGAWHPSRGKVRLDGAALDQLSSEALGRDIGYLPQSVELLAGTITQNISRFDPDVKPEAVVAAATAAGVHEMILRLPNGYETDVGEDGQSLSAGQRQRVALARALYGEPFLVVLDEPNSNLDADGEASLGAALLGIRRRGGIAVIVAHRPSALVNVDMVLAMSEGRVIAFGARDEVMQRVTRNPNVISAPAAALRVVGDHGSAR